MASLSPALGDTSRNINDDDSGNYNDRGNDRDGRNYGTVDYLCLPPDQEHHLMNIESSFHMDSDIGNLSRRLGPSPIPSNHLSLHPEEEESNTSMLNKAVPTSAPAPVPPDASSHRRSDSNFSLASDASTGAMVGGLSSPSSAPGTVTSSPTVEALARNMSRATAATSNLTEMLHAQTPSDVSERANSPRASEIGIALMHQISSTSSQGARDYSSLAHLPSRPHSAAYTNPRVSSANRPISKSASASTLIPPPSSIASSNGTRKPKFLRSRNSSQRSSISSLASDMNDQDDDYASTVTGMGAERRPLSRQASLGSIASGITGLMAPSTVFGYDRITASSSAADRNLARLDEEERNSGTGSDDESAHPAPPANTTPSANSSASSSIVTLSEIDDKDRPHTPKERAPPLPNPTETAITAQVGNVKVPPTAKREYSKRLGIHLEVPGSPSKKAVASAGTPATGRGREMTLKEQTASIDRLQKENFDLKIKVYYLNEKLEKMSDEGIKEAMKENIDLKVRLAEGVRERKQLKKRIRDLEKQVEQLGGEKEREEEASAAAESEEIWELKERIERYEAENVEFRRRDAERNERLRDFRRQANGHQINEEQLVCPLASVTCSSSLNTGDLGTTPGSPYFRAGPPGSP